MDSQVTLEQLVQLVVALRRILWDDSKAGSTMAIEGTTSLMDLSARLARSRPGVPAEARETVASRWMKAPRAKSDDGGRPLTFEDLCKVILPDGVRAADSRYFATRSIRARYGVRLSFSTAAFAHDLARNILAEVERSTNREVSHEALARVIEEAELTRSKKGDVPLHIGDAFLDLCLVLNLFGRADASDKVAMRPECADAEFLLSNLFGLPTSISGFDALFGGGLMLPDSAAESTTPTSSGIVPDSIGGRSILCIGPFGSGKTILSLQFALEVARKGGVAWVMTLEQTAEECLYALESLGISTEDPAFRTDKKLTDSFVTLSDPRPTRGALVFLRPSDSPLDYAEFMRRTEEQLSWMETYPLRLLVVDPVNAFSQSGENWGMIRPQLRKMLESAKRANVNIWLTSEVATGEQEANRFEENIADTVLHLGLENILGQRRRYIEVTKSRFQHESTGRHGFVIDSHSGVHIYPSSAVIASQASARGTQTSDVSLDFGILGIERLIGPEPIRPGDVVALAGPGKAKTMVGVRFLLAGDDVTCRSAYVSDLSRTRIQRSIRTIAASDRCERISFVEPCSLPSGYVDPGELLQQIQMTLGDLQAKGATTLRVLLTNLARWEDQMPLIAKDSTFGLALINLVRSYNAACIVICGDRLEPESRFLHTMFDQADILIHSHKREFQGRATTLMTALKTRSMRHQREASELSLDSTGMRIRPAPLFRITSSGDVHDIKITLFLHAETDNHKKLNDRMVAGLRATISPKAEIEPQLRRFEPGLLSMSEYSAVDELQVIQLDEFQLPTVAASTLPLRALYHFDQSLSGGILAESLPEFRERVSCDGDRSFLGVPFYANISFFAINKERGDRMKAELEIGRLPQSWRELADLSEAWEAKHRESADVLFSCPIYEDGIETYNCLFFEILYSLQPPTTTDFDDLSRWLSQPAAIDAACIFRQVCKRSHQAFSRSIRDFRAVISRHWYNTLNQQLSTTPEERAEIEVQALFGDITTAGEWYLAIPSHSASPEVGLRLLEYLTSPENETSRLEAGVGLPVRAAYYEGPEAHATSVSRYFRFDRQRVRKLLRNAIRRSSMRHYQRFSNTISSHLRWILEIPEPHPGAKCSDEPIRSEVTRTIMSLVTNIKFLSHGTQNSNA